MKLNNDTYSDNQVRAARAQLWAMGNLQWKLNATQQRMVSFYRNCQSKTIVANAGRRTGKTWALIIMSMELCIQKPGAIVKFLQPDKTMLRTNTFPDIHKILDDCPPELRPKFNKLDSEWVFPNRSKIQMRGSDSGHFVRLRGGNADLCIIDEAGFVKAPLEEVVQDVLLPTTMLTKGKIILSSTTPTDPDHPFLKYMEYAQNKGAFITTNMFEVYEESKGGPNCHLSSENIEEFISSYPGGVSNPRFRREVLNEVVRDENKVVIPEFTDVVEKDVVVEWPRPAFFDPYVAMDIGFSDLTVALFGYYDFDNAIIVIEDELVMNGPTMTTEALAENIRKKERNLWFDKISGEVREPYLRVSDNNLIVINDLQRMHGISFIPTQKDNKEAQINNLRMDLMNRRVSIHPRCKVLIQHLKHATWNSARNDFTRSPDNGHYDALSAAIYFARNIDRNRSPYPKGYRLSRLGNPGELFVGAGYKSNVTETADKFSNMFKPKTSLRRFKP